MQNYDSFCFLKVQLKYLFTSCLKLCGVPKYHMTVHKKKIVFVEQNAHCFLPFAQNTFLTTKKMLRF